MSQAAGLPRDLAANPILSRWIRLRPEGVVEICPGKVEIGQGILTALAQLAADELDVGLDRIRMVPANTAASPNEGMTSGSLSVEDSGMAVRYACAEARAILVAAAAERLGVAAQALSVEDGVIRGPGNLSASYFDMAGDGLLDREATGIATPKPATARRFGGKPVERLDLPDKIYGALRFIHDLVLPDMLHGRVLRPQSPGATLTALDPSAVEAMPGVKAVLRDGSFAGVVADTEWQAEQALARLRAAASWEERPAPALPDETRLTGWLKSAAAEIRPVAERAAEQPASPARTIRRDYFRPYIAHASIGPSCAIARFGEIAAGEPSPAAGDQSLHVWAHSQGIFNLRADLALVLAMRPEAIIVEHAEGAGCYGHNGADDVALDAALLARAVPGLPVRVQWSREDELGWSPFGPAMAVTIEADLDASGEIGEWRCDLWSNGHTTRPGRAPTPTLLAGHDLEAAFPRLPGINPPFAHGGGAERNSVPPYDFPALRVTNHYIAEVPIRVSALRTLGAFINVFAAESFMDEIAAERGEDPVAFRLRQLSDPRARAVIEAAASRFGWAGWQKREGFGRGIGYAAYKGKGAYCAVIAEIEAAQEIRVRRLAIAVDVGEVVNPDGVVNQIEGGAIQATSWTLKEAVRFDRTRITSTQWDSYPILRFSEVPAVDVVLLDRPSAPPLGAGEAALGPTAAAIGNAVFDAIGVRVRHLPLTPENIVAAMA
jgi:nicotinate dehydrogenase subunit B